MYVFYDNTGKIIGAVAADSPNVQLTKIPEGTTALYLDDATNSAVWNNLGEYKIDLATKQPVYTPIADSVKLQAAKDAKIKELEQKRDAALNGGFQSSALGTPHTYSSDMIAQANFDGEFAYLNSPVSTDTTVDWYTWENGMVTHTKAQFNQVYADGRAFKRSTWTKFANLEAQVKAATTVAQVNAIVW